MRREETFSVGGHVTVDVELPAGSLLLRTRDAGSVAVSVDSGGADAFDIGQLGDTISIRAGRRGRSARVVVDTPLGSDVNVKGASLDVAARGPLGALRIRSASGDLVADDLVRADVSVTSGDCRVEVVRNDAAFNTTSGDIDVRSVGGRFTATVSSGDVTVGDADGDAEVQTASGDVRLRRCNGSAIAVRTVSGDISIGLPSGIRVEPEISTLSGRVSLPQAAAPVPEADRRTVRVRLRSISGDITVARAIS